MAALISPSAAQFTLHDHSHFWMNRTTESSAIPTPAPRYGTTIILSGVDTKVFTEGPSTELNVQAPLTCDRSIGRYGLLGAGASSIPSVLVSSLLNTEHTPP